MNKYDERHGGPFDRGTSDAYYRRPFDLHYYVNGTGTSPRMEIQKGTPEYEAYDAGFSYQMLCSDFKEWE